MKRVFIFIYGVVSYLIFFGCFLYLIGFLANAFVPKSIDSGATGALLPALLINLALVVLFGVQHSVMARRCFKRRLARFVPGAAERSTFVLASSLVLIVTFWLWRPFPQVVWEVEQAWLRAALWGLMGVGVFLILLSSFLINHFELFGLQQVYLNLRRKRAAPIAFGTPLLYRLVRHPLHLGTTTLLWATPQMTAGHLFFAAAMTTYILIGIYFEERDLERHFGDAYRAYQRSTPRLLPLPRPAAHAPDAAKSPASAGD